jgi:hypothetical protein
MISTAGIKVLENTAHKAVVLFEGKTVELTPVEDGITFVANGYFHGGTAEDLRSFIEDVGIYRGSYVRVTRIDGVPVDDSFYGTEKDAAAMKVFLCRLEAALNPKCNVLPEIPGLGVPDGRALVFAPSDDFLIAQFDEAIIDTDETPAYRDDPYRAGWIKVRDLVERNDTLSVYDDLDL